jgi:ribulose-phosphate 3-epimerase
MVLVMSVEPGFGGQSFIEASLDNVKGLADYREKNGLSYQIEIDGGINLDNISRVIDDGVDIVVAGSSVFNKGELGTTCDKFLKLTGEI